MNVSQMRTDPHFESIGQAGAAVLANAAKARDAYDFWRRALEIGAGRQLTREQATPLNATTEPQSGFFRKRNKNGKDIAVAIWSGEQGVVALADGNPVDADAIWTFCLSWPISHEQYDAVVERGEPWPDDGPVRGSGDNLPEDPHEAAKVEFEGEKEAAEEILRNPIKTQADADRAAVASKRLSDLHGKVDGMYETEKIPIRAAGKAIDEKYRWREEPKALSVKLKRAQDDFLRESDKIEQERQRKAREEQAKLQREAEEKALKAAAEANKTSAEEHAKLQREADEAAAAAAAKARESEAQKVYAGRTGAKTSLRTFVDAEITDYDKLVVALKDRQEVKELVQSLANRAAKGGVELPGMKIRSEKRAA